MNTHCIFARKAVLWAGADWDSTCDTGTNIAASAKALVLFCALQQGVDGFVLQIPHAEHMAKSSDAPNDTNALNNECALTAHATMVYTVLQHITRADPAGADCVNIRRVNVGGRGWAFRYN